MLTQTTTALLVAKLWDHMACGQSSRYLSLLVHYQRQLWLGRATEGAPVFS